MEGDGVDNNLKCWELVQEVSEKNFSMLTGNHCCDILVKVVVAFCPCLKSLPKAKVKNFELILSSEELSKQPSIDFVMWILVVTLIKIYNERSKLRKEKTFEKKRGTRK